MPTCGTYWQFNNYRWLVFSITYHIDFQSNQGGEVMQDNNKYIVGASEMLCFLKGISLS